MRFTWVILIMLFATCQKDNQHESLLGQWRCEEYRESGENRQYNVSISHDPLSSDTSMYVISNFYQLGNSEEALVRIKNLGGGKLEIPSQIVLSIGISGEGTVDNDFSEISLKYFIQSGTVNEQVEANYY